MQEKPRSRPFAFPFDILLAGLILLLGWSLRLWGLDQHNIWWDEGLTAWVVRLPVSQIFAWTAHDVHPPLYFLISRWWWLLMGDGVWGLRFLPAMAGVAAVALTYALAATLAGRRAGLSAATFLALSPFAIAWSQELRMYIWAALWATGALWAAVRYWRTRRIVSLVAYVLFVAAALWTLYLSVTVLIIANLAFIVWLLATSRTSRRARPQPLPWVIAQVAAVALFAPWLAYALPRMMSWSSAEPFTTGLFIRLYATVLATGVTEHIEAWLGPTLLVFLIFGAAIVGLWRSRRTPAQTAGLALLLLGVVLPAFLVLALTTPAARRFYVPRLAPRYFLPLAAAFYVLLGWGLNAWLSRWRSLAWLAGLAVAVVSVAGLAALLPGRTQTDQYASLVATLAAHQQTGEPVMLYPDDDWPLFAARYPGMWEKAPRQGAPRQGAPRQGAPRPELLDDQLGQVWNRAETGLWVVRTPKAGEMDPQGAITDWLDRHAAGKVSWSFGENALLFYPRTSGRLAHAGDVVAGRPLPRAPWGSLGGVDLLALDVPLRRIAAGDTFHIALYWASAPPAGSRLVLDGPVHAEAGLADRAPVSRPPYRTLVHLSLTPELRAGRYRLSLEDGEGGALPIGDITIVARNGLTIASGRAVATHLPNVALGDHVHLVGYDLATTIVAPGQAVELVLYWQTDAVLATRYKVFTHLLGEVWNADQGNFLWGQWDAEPCVGECPTTTWPPDTIIVDAYRIPVAPNAPPGVYTLEVGMYELLEGARLPVMGGASGDAVVLGQVEVR